MCGIAGTIYHEASRPALDLKPILATIDHRGPDDSGIFTDGSLSMGMNRLSIIDLAGGHQPMSDVSQRYWIVFNGEIYNYRELRDRLASLGYPFRTTSDTEVILAGYIHWGKDILAQLNGMFAFAVWDKEARKLWLARDHMGIKPLYYANLKDGFRFASEIKALVADSDVPRSISRIGLSNFLTFAHSIAPYTMYEGIYKLPPAHQLTYQQGDIHIERYWRVPSSGQPPLDQPDEIIPAVRTLLDDAVAKNMVADVPVGAFLSGGLDSTAVVSRMVHLTGKVKTFSLGFDDPQHNELSAARLVAKHFGTEHHEITPTFHDLPPLLEKLVYHYDEPFGDASSFPTYVVSTLASQHVKVVLTGDGGDELFGGYRRHLGEYLVPTARLIPRPLRQFGLQVLNQFPTRQHRLRRILRNTLAKTDAERYAGWITFFTQQQRSASVMPEYVASDYDPVSIFHRLYEESSGLDPVNQGMYADMHTRMVDGYLEKVDKATMAASLEARVPLLDYRLVELAQRIPSNQKIYQRQTKAMWRKAIADLIPQEILTLPKHGFSVPTKPWFKGELSQFVLDVLTDPRVQQRGVFRPQAVKQLWDDHQSGRGIYDNQLWLLLNFELWARQFLDQAPVSVA